jgi:hypothetical protein
MRAAVKSVVDAETSLADAELAAETAAVGTDDGSAQGRAAPPTTTASQNMATTMSIRK